MSASLIDCYWLGVVNLAIGRVDRFNQPNALAEHVIKKA